MTNEIIEQYPRAWTHKDGYGVYELAGCGDYFINLDDHERIVAQLKDQIDGLVASRDITELFHRE